MVFGNGVKNIQAAAYNGARTVLNFHQQIIVISSQNNVRKYHTKGHEQVDNYPLLFFSYPIMPTNTRKLQTLTSQLSPLLLALSVNRVYQATPHMLPPPLPPPWLSGLPSQFIKCHQRTVVPK